MKAYDTHKVNVKFKINSEHSISEHGSKVELASLNILQCFFCYVWPLFFSQVEKYWMIFFFFTFISISTEMPAFQGNNRN